MSVSDIAVTALTAVATVKGNQLTITTSDPRSGALQNIALDHVDIYASQTDTFASASVVAQGTLRALHADAGEEQTWYYWGIPYDKLGAAGTRFPSGATGGVACTSLGQAGLSFGLSNGKIVASVSGNALTIAIKTAAGNDPSASDRVYCAFPNATTTSGNYVLRAITSALSLVISNGSTLGASTAAVAFRLYAILFDDAGTVRLGAINCSFDPGVIKPLTGTGTASSTAEGGAGAADSAGVFYTATAVSSKQYRAIGSLDWISGLATPGAWAVSADPVRMLSQNSPMPGMSIQENAGINQNGGSTGTTLIPFDNTKPQVTEGITGGFLNITGTSVCNFFEVEYEFNLAHSVTTEMTLALFLDGAANAIAAVWAYAPTANKPIRIHLKHRFRVPNTSGTTVEARFGAGQAGTTTLNGISGGAWYGGVLTEAACITEICG
jgi:hypothetical protein